MLGWLAADVQEVDAKGERGREDEHEASGLPAFFELFALLQV
jgi:hypothetical protein